MHLARARLGVDKESINQYQELIARFPQYIMRYIEMCSKLSQSIAFSSGPAGDNRCISMNNFHLLICYCCSAPHRLARNSSSLCIFFLRCSPRCHMRRRGSIPSDIESRETAWLLQSTAEHKKLFIFSAALQKISKTEKNLFAYNWAALPSYAVLLRHIALLRQFEISIGKEIS